MEKQTNPTAPLSDSDMENCISQLSAMLGLEADVLRSMVGKRVKGTAEFSRSGGFRFDPARSSGKTQEEVRKTPRGSKLVRTLGESRLKLSCTAPADEPDPEGWIADEVNRLLKDDGMPRVRRRCRIIDRSERIDILADLRGGKILLSVTVPFAEKTDLYADTVSTLSDLLKRMSLNRSKIEKLQRDYIKERSNQTTQQPNN